MKLPSPKKSGDLSVEKVLEQRRSVRDYSDKSLTFKQMAQLLWSAQGITSREGLRSAPSAGALHPLELFVVAGVYERTTG